MPTLKRITDTDYLLCHRCGLPLNKSAHKECAEAAQVESRSIRRSTYKIKRAFTAREFEGVGTLGHTPCRLDDGSVIIPADEAAKIRNEGFTSRQTGVVFGPWTSGILRESSRVQRREADEEAEAEVIQEIEELDGYYDDDDSEDLFSLAYGYSSKIFVDRLFSSKNVTWTPE